MKHTKHYDWNINTAGIVPFICDRWEGQPLFIIKGGICGSMFPDIYGEAYTYETFPWENKKPTKKECLIMAEKNNINRPSLWVTKELSKQFKEILEDK